MYSRESSRRLTASSGTGRGRRREERDGRREKRGREGGREARSDSYHSH